MNRSWSSIKAPATALVTVALVSLFPILSLLASNVGQLDVAQASRSLGSAVLLGWVLLAIARLACRNWHAAALLTIGLLLLFYAYGHVYDLVRHLEIAGVLVGRHRFLVPLWGLACAGWIGVVIRKRPRPSPGLLLVVAASLVILPSTSLVVSGIQGAVASGRRADGREETPGQPATAALPDICYIILDAYGREDVLADLYGFDNLAFIEALEERGFYVADQARANYSQTLASLASSLNMTYLDDLAARMGPRSVDRAPLIELLKHSAVRETLESHEYQTLAFETGHLPTELYDADLYFSPPYARLDLTPSSTGALPINEFEGLLAKTTALRPILDDLERREDLSVQLLSFPYQKHRMRVTYTLQTIPIAGQLDGPQFVFAHVVCPHPPFVFTRPGQDLVPSGAFTMQDAGCCSRDEYLEGYAGQLPAVNALVLEMVDQILSEAGPEPVIIIQGDHGPAAFVDNERPLSSNMRERLSILNAYHLPGDAERLLYPSITPVNTFGLVLEVLFGQPRTPLPDESYFAPGTQPYNFQLVTSRASAR